MKKNFGRLSSFYVCLFLNCRIFTFCSFYSFASYFCRRHRSCAICWRSIIKRKRQRECVCGVHTRERNKTKPQNKHKVSQYNFLWCWKTISLFLIKKYIPLILFQQIILFLYPLKSCAAVIVQNCGKIIFEKKMVIKKVENHNHFGCIFIRINWTIAYIKLLCSE